MPSGLGNAKPPRAHRQPRVVRRERSRINPGFQRLQRQLVRLLRVQREEQRPGKIENGSKHRIFFPMEILSPRMIMHQRFPGHLCVCRGSA